METEESLFPYCFHMSKNPKKVVSYYLTNERNPLKTNENFPREIGTFSDNVQKISREVFDKNLVSEVDVWFWFKGEEYASFEKRESHPDYSLELSGRDSKLSIHSNKCEPYGDESKIPQILENCFNNFKKINPFARNDSELSRVKIEIKRRTMEND